LHVEVGHGAGRDEVDVPEVVVEAGAAVAAESARRQVALVGLHQVLALGEPEVLLRHHDAGQARPDPVLTARAVAVAQRLRIGALELHSAAEACARERLRHDDPLPMVGRNDPGHRTRPLAALSCPGLDIAWSIPYTARRAHEQRTGGARDTRCEVAGARDGWPRP